MNRRPLFASVAALALLAVMLPVSLPPSTEGPAADCLTLPEAPAGAARSAALERCRAANPGAGTLLADLGIAREARGRLAAAESAYRQALVVDPDLADVRLRLARLLLARGDADGARLEAAAALVMEPNRRAAVELLEEANHKLAARSRDLTAAGGSSRVRF